ncbi:AraC family transcriptional regulator [Photobacterium atrarenae]|uniref:AraC family transcriptional regulator n=1 Tax=Photobacterium atrarenae TaxID=865757 RepID=A0ABY5GPF0_9GAMM|nr:AraC family transcriptional regulator [Photobacterium atrarenae]UTV30626.1 AraC family transcriptional regulator [Photobacterium atrarenae]
MSHLNRLSIRAYTSQTRSHYHEYHQLVLPLHGTIDIKVGDYHGKISPGDGVTIPAGERHDFRAHEQARFLVADLDQLPDNLRDATSAKFIVSPPLLAYCQYLGVQLAHQVNPALEQASFELFCLLVAEQTSHQKLDPRLEPVIEAIAGDLSAEHSLSTLASLACLSLTQFKKVFKASTGMTAQQYITRQRMEKAKALLTHSDLPVRLVAEQVGYQDLSAFSRRFSRHYGQPPSAFST